MDKNITFFVKSVGNMELFFYIFTFDLFWFVHYNDVTEKKKSRSFTKNFSVWYKCKNERNDMTHKKKGEGGKYGS